MEEGDGTLPRVIYAMCLYLRGREIDLRRMLYPLRALGVNGRGRRVEEEGEKGKEETRGRERGRETFMLGNGVRASTLLLCLRSRVRMLASSAEGLCIALLSSPPPSFPPSPPSLPPRPPLRWCLRVRAERPLMARFCLRKVERTAELGPVKRLPRLVDFLRAGGQSERREKGGDGRLRRLRRGERRERSGEGGESREEIRR